jgi:hypothetical protein
MVLIFCKKSGPRFQYISKLIFTEVLKIDYSVIQDPADFMAGTGTKINYSYSEFPDALQITPCGLLEENNIHLLSVNAGDWQCVPVIFTNNNKNFPFDIFSAAFYMTTRYEEYLPFVPDTHGRFEANQSIAFVKHFIRQPIVDLWCKLLAVKLNIYDQCKGIQPSNFRFRLTVDIDRAWQYKNSGLFRNLAILSRDLMLCRIELVKSRLSVLLGQKPDPAENFDYLESIQTNLKEKIRYFVLCGKPGKFDNNNPSERIEFKNLLNKLNRHSLIGLHPSYQSNSSYNILEEEFYNLEKLVNQKIFHSRQHFLKICFPVTYRRLMKLGILHDFSMGYSSCSGFRAGIARPFFFYDLSAEKQTDLRIVPFQVMDRTLLSYLKLSPDEALKEIEYYFETIGDVGGYFVTLWHNTSLSDQGEWKGWKIVFEKMIEMSMQKSIPSAVKI